MAPPATPRLLDAETTAAVILGASDWTKAGLGLAPSFRRSAKGIQRYLFDNNGLCLDPELVLDLFNDPASAGEQLARLRDTLDELLRERREEGRPVTDLLIYYVGHGSTDDQGRLTLLVRPSQKGLETETGIKAADLARVLKVSAPQQRRLVVLDCCFSEAAARDFVGQGGLDQAVAATAVKDIAEALPSRGGVLLCSSPVGEIGIGKPDAAHTLFTGAVIEVLRSGVAWRDSLLSFADLRDEAYDVMLQSFGARAPRPALHAFNQTQGDLTRLPAFPNRAVPAADEDQERRNKEEKDRLEARNVARLAKEAAEREAIAKAQKDKEEKDRHTAEEVTRLAKETAEQARSNAVSIDQGDIALAEGKYAEAHWLYLQAADKGDARAQERIGRMYQNGWGVPKDYRQSLLWYQKAADQGDARAQTHIGWMYQNGMGLGKDYERALEWYKKASDQGDADAQTKIGLLFFYGSGVPKDRVEARDWLTKAAAGGDINAKKWLSVIHDP